MNKDLQMEKTGHFRLRKLCVGFKYMSQFKAHRSTVGFIITFTEEETGTGLVIGPFLSW